MINNHPLLFLSPFFPARALSLSLSLFLHINVCMYTYVHIYIHTREYIYTNTHIMHTHIHIFFFLTKLPLYLHTSQGWPEQEEVTEQSGGGGTKLMVGTPSPWVIDEHT